MAKTLRFRIREGWVTKPLERLAENRLLPEEVDDNFLALEDQYLALASSYGRQPLPIRDRSASASYALVLEDQGSWVRVNRESATTVTVPNNTSVSFEIGTRIWVRRAGAGSVTLQAAGGVTLRAPALTIDQHRTVMLVKVGTNEWDLSS